MDLGIRDKVFMVAASSKGLGLGLQRRLRRTGAKLSLASRSADNIEAAASKLREAHGVEVRGYTFDATDAGSITEWRQNIGRFR